MVRKTDESKTSLPEMIRQTNITWSRVQTRIVSSLLLFYLFLVVLAPLSNPISSRSLTGPISQFFSPALQGLYLNHGYRFFGPEPGPTHLVEFRLEFSDSEPETGLFPDPDEQWPRLLYHRWFMLSETIFAEYDMTPTEVAHREQLMNLAAIADQLKSEGHFSVSDKVKAELNRERERYEMARTRIDILSRSVARYLLTSKGAKTIELRIVERALPTPLDHVLEVPMSDEKFLTRLRTIAKFEIDDSGDLKSLPIEEDASSGGLEQPTSWGADPLDRQPLSGAGFGIGDGQ